MQHKLMVLGSMTEFVELVKLAKRKGIYTVVCDGYADGPAKAFADESYNIDVRCIDEIAAVCKREGVDGIIASFSDLLAECMVSIANVAGLPCYAKPEPFRFLREKPMMKQMLAELGIQTARSTKVFRDSMENDIAPIGFPCVVKPVNGYGSRGIYVLNSAEELAERFDDVASHSSFEYILAERYIEGHEFNMMNWILDGEVITISVADREKSPRAPHLIPDVSRCAYPSRLMDCVYDDARDIIAKVAEYVGITNGPLSMQFFYVEGEGIYVCEIAGRLFGYEHELVTMACGLSIEEMLLNYVYDQAALKGQLEAHSAFFDTCSAGLYFHGREGVIADQSLVRQASTLPGVSEVLLFYKDGQQISNQAGGAPYVARIYIEADNRSNLDRLTYELYKTVKVLDRDGNNLLFEKEITEY